MDVANLISRVREHGADGIGFDDRDALRFRPREGRRLRAEIVNSLLADYRQADLPLLRILVQEEIAARRVNDGCGKVLFGLVLMLYAVGEVEDTLLIHSAKFANMDAGGMIDQYMLRMRRSETEVTAFVRRRLTDEPTASRWPLERVLRDVRRAFESDDFESPDECVRGAIKMMDATYVDDFDEDSYG